MATLERIRSKGILLLIVIGLALVAFIVGDFLNNSSSLFTQSQENIAEIDGEVYKIQEYQALTAQLEGVYKIEYSRSSLDENTMVQIRKTVWDNLIKNNLLKIEADKLGLVVSTKEMEDMTLGQMPHQLLMGRRIFADPKTGMFDKNRMITFLSQLDRKPSSAQEQEEINSLKSYWMYFETIIKNGELENKYNVLLNKALNVNSIEAQMAYESKRNVVDFLYAFKPYSSVADDKVKVSDSDIAAKYKENKERYKQESSRDVKYVAFSLNPSKEDFARADKWINDLKEDFSTTTEIESVVNPNSLPYKDIALSENDIDADLRVFAFSGQKNDVFGPTLFGNTYKMARIIETGITAPDSIKLKHIIVATEEEEKTEKLVDSIMTALQAGAAFAPLASKYSQMQETAVRGGEVGWVPVATSQDEIIQVCVSKPINTYFTYKDGNATQIIQVTEKTANRRKVKLAVISNEVKPSQDTYSDIYNEAKQFAANNTTISKFEKGAEKNGYVVLPAIGLEENTPSINGVKSSRQIIRWAFDNEEANIVSDVYDCETKFVVAIVTAVHNKGYKEIETVKDEITSMLMPEKKAAIIVAEINSKKGKNIQTLASELAINVDTAKQINFQSSTFGSLGFEPAAIAHASVVKLNEVSKPIEGNQGVFVVQAYNVFENPTPFDKNLEMQTLARQYSNLSSGASDVLKEKTEIVDNRSSFY